MDSDEPITREHVLRLIEQKDEIERKLQELKQVLDGNGIGMNECLLDFEGYPRQDIDVYQVRHARHNIICLQNDHKAIMKEIEEGLHILHAQMSDVVGHSSTYNRREEERPIAWVSYVEPGSPADIAGLQHDDLIVRFGTINYDNFKTLRDVAELTHNSYGRKVLVTIKRRGQTEKLYLVPTDWKGKGLLGCSIMPLEHVER